RGLVLDVVDWEEHAQVEQEGAHRSQQISALLQRGEILPQCQLLGAGREPRSEGEVSEDQHPQYQKGGDSHGPAEPDFPDQMVQHDGEDDAAETRAACDDADCKGAPLMEPGNDAVCRGREEAAAPYGGADALCEEDLVVFFTQRDHHEPKDVEKGAS
ncbi:hypothetical protein V491_06363, partial [Pseudogymnoascus sp. VKM F-3775]